MKNLLLLIAFITMLSCSSDDVEPNLGPTFRVEEIAIRTIGIYPFEIVENETINVYANGELQRELPAQTQGIGYSHPTFETLRVCYLGYCEEVEL